MAKRDVRGLHRVVSKGQVYWYAWRGRGAPRVHGEYGTPDFWASYDAGVRDRHVSELGKFRALVTQYKASTDYEKLAPVTKSHWGPWLDRVAAYFGDLSIAQFDRPEKIRPEIRKWRNKYATTPRTADIALQVLSLVCAHAVDPLGKLAGNPCVGIKRLYTSDRADIIWTEADVAKIKQHCTAEVAHAIDLAAATGLRRSHLLKLAWSHIHEEKGYIELVGMGNRHKRPGIIPLYDGLREVLVRIPKRSPVVLTNSRGRPWKDGFGVMFNLAKIDAGIGSELHFHDLRGTAATRFYVAGLSERVIAEIMGWTEENVAKIIRKYVDRTAATKAVIRQLNAQKVN
jgi:integrase